MTLENIKAELIAKNPVLRSGSNETGYQELTPKEYETVINQWAETILARQAKETAKTEAAAAKLALLERLGITIDESKLLLS